MSKYLVKGRMNIGGKVFEGTAQKPVEVELPSDRFFITAPRYLNEEYIPASPMDPVEITLPEGSIIDSGMRPGEAPEAPKPHFIPGRTSSAPSASETFSKGKDGKAKRPSDTEV